MNTSITKLQAKRIWLHAQKLDEREPFGSGAEAVPAAVQHLGYVQIDTIHVIERSHHHVLYSRIPQYRREHLQQAQSVDKTVFEYWAHALAYLPIGELPHYVRTMRQYAQSSNLDRFFAAVKNTDIRRMLARIRRDGALTIRDIEDDVLVEKEYAWASRKPSKRVLQLAFNQGLVTISQRSGMLKTYELLPRHFGWKRLPAAATERETLNYLLDRALRSQGIVSLDSICYLHAARKPGMQRLIESRIRNQQLLPVDFAGSAGKWQHWAKPEDVERKLGPAAEQVHILSPFDPLIIQRKRLELFFEYQHRFEAYVPKHKRIFGYFACPVLIGDQIVAALDLKTDRAKRKLLIQKWTWIGQGSSRAHKKKIEGALHAFERFQLPN